jgi:hypothetical protein
MNFITTFSYQRTGIACVFHGLKMQKFKEHSILSSLLVNLMSVQSCTVKAILVVGA